MTTTCQNHNVRMISYEAIFHFKWSTEPTNEIYIFKCFSCGEGHTMKFKTETRANDQREQSTAPRN